MEYVEKESDVIAINILYDINPAFTCAYWADLGNSTLPIIIDGGDSFDSVSLIKRFFPDYNNTMPRHVFIDHELKLHSIFEGHLYKEDVRIEINEMLEKLNGAK